MRRRRIGTEGTDSPQMTSMIDVVFLLLVFFVITAKPVEVIGRLDADQATSRGTSTDGLVIKVDARGFGINGTRITTSELDSILSDLAERSTEQSIVVACTPESEHDRLITVLDLCAKADLKNIAMARL